MPRRPAAALLSGVLLFSGCVRNPVTGRREFHMISEKAELRLGQESKNQIVKEYGLYRNPAVQSYVNEVGQRIAKVCERRDVPYEFVLLDTPLVNAFAVPGVVFLTRGILELIDDEAELAAVIGHEVGHITNFHAVKLIQKSYGYGFLATFAAVAGTLYAPTLRDSREYAAYYDTLYRGIGLVTAGFLSGYGREFESEADDSGLRYAVLAGYDPDAMISFFKRMDALADDSEISIFLRTHPPTKSRIRQVEHDLELARDLSQRKAARKPVPRSIKQIAQVLESSGTALQDNYERYQEVVKTLPAEEPSGIVRGKTFLHPQIGVKIEIPEGWKYERTYGRSLITFRNPDGKAGGTLEHRKILPDPLIHPSTGSAPAGIWVATRPVTSQEWAETLEEDLKMEKRLGREVTYPAGEAYTGVYRGRDRVGRPAVYKILYLVRGERPGRQDGFLLSCWAPEESYLDYLLAFEQVMRSLAWTP